VISPHAGERERNAFEALTREHLSRLYAFALRLTGERAAAEDLVQETYLKAYQAFHHFLSGRDTRPWLTKILLNAYRDQVRRECRAPAPLQPEDLDAWYQASRQAHASHLRTYGPEEQVIGRAFSDEVAAALADLPPDFRTVVLLADLEGYSYREIADLVECPIGTVMSRLARGRKLLREMLRDYARKHGLIEG
jgi:RNA polymerase sigma-70 factor, ECF subfamily